MTYPDEKRFLICNGKNQQHNIPNLNAYLTFHLEQVVHQGFALIVMIYWLECCLNL